MHLHRHAQLVLWQMHMVIRSLRMIGQQCQYALPSTLYPDVNIAGLSRILIGIEPRIGLSFQYRCPVALLFKLACQPCCLLI